MWEWMYGGGPPVPGSIGDPDIDVGAQTLRPYFSHIAETLRCPFCQGELTDNGRYSVCASKHSFATCAATGVAISSPSISRACGVCGRRTLNAHIIERMVQETKDISLKELHEWFIDMCGGCGGKFIA